MSGRSNFSTEKYIAARDRLVERNEAFIDNIYLDSYGLPTAGIGVLLVDRQRDRSWQLNHSRVNLLADVTNLSDLDREKLISTLEKYTDVLDRHRDEKYQNLAAFKNSAFGAEAKAVLGDISFNRTTSSWDVLTSNQSTMKFKMTHDQTLKLYNSISSDYENRLDRLLREKNCPKEALSEEQRAGLYSMVYHGSRFKAGKMADAIGDYWRGEISEEQLLSRIQRDGMDSKFPERSRNEINYMIQIKERPNQRGVYNSVGLEDVSRVETLMTDNFMSQSNYEKTRAMLQGLLNDTDGSYAKKLLANHPEEVASFNEKIQESIEQTRLQELTERESRNTLQQEEQQRSFSRSV
ncbi:MULTISPECIES: hypothetical protein [unclassified Neisseria]|jgi:putative membrane protein|nr:hypothetical protein HMPREF3156_00011 [Neisseria sp. HMSC06F02]OFS04593.1 hypothetical protein HMPREF2954_01225 [Neisseria sp. HMSC067H09]